MKTKILNILMLLAICVGAGSCVHEDFSECPEQDPKQPGYVYLNLNLDVLDNVQGGATRASLDDMNGNNYLQEAISEYEKIKSVRVIIVRGEPLDLTTYPGMENNSGYVEHNQLFTLYNGVVRYDNMRFKVQGGEKKKIYFIVNEDLVEEQNHFDFDAIRVGNVYGGSIELLQLTRLPQTALIDNSGPENTQKYIPMSECFDIEVPTPKNPEDFELRMKDFFVTRAAVKFSFNVQFAEGLFLKDPDWYVKDITVSNIADTEYFLPRGTVYKDVTDPNGLKGKVIMDYTTPDRLVRTPYVFNKEISYTPGVQQFMPAFYFPESGKNERYDVSMTLANRTNEETIVFGPALLDNLPSLPRNTHVVVNISLDNNRELSATTTIFPYTAVNLNPEFGFTNTPTDKLTIASTLELDMNDPNKRVGLIYATYTSDVGNRIENLIWVSSDPTVILLGKEDANISVDEQLFDSIELPYQEPVKVVPKKQGTADVTVYSQTGLVATCKVTVK